MLINFLVNEVAGGWEPTDTRLGGTEESVAQWAEELARRGHLVNVYRNGRSDERHIPFGKFPCYLPRGEEMRPADICINIKSSEVAPKEPTLYLTNETNANQLDLSAYVGVIWPSQWAVDNIPVNNKTFILPHGYDPKKIYPGKKIPKQCFYASSPDRGLDTLLEAWPKVYKAHPDATLLLTYGATSDLPGVISLGEVDEETMNEIYRTSDIWCHPANGGELYCITGIKAQAAGCWPVIIPTMALAETVRYGTKTTKEDYADALIKALDDHSTPPKLDYPTWGDSVTMLLDIIETVKGKTNGQTTSRLKQSR